MPNSNGIERQTYDRWVIWSISWLSHLYLKKKWFNVSMTLSFIMTKWFTVHCRGATKGSSHSDKCQSLHSVLHNIYKTERFHIKIVKIVINKELKIHIGMVPMSNLEENCYIGLSLEILKGLTSCVFVLK